MHGIYCLCEKTAKADRSRYDNSLNHHILSRILRITYVTFGNTHNSLSSSHLLGEYLK